MVLMARLRSTEQMIRHPQPGGATPPPPHPEVATSLLIRPTIKRNGLQLPRLPVGTKVMDGGWEASAAIEVPGQKKADNKGTEEGRRGNTGVSLSLSKRLRRLSSLITM